LLDPQACMWDPGAMTDVVQSSPNNERDLARVARLIGDPARSAILKALADGRAMPAGELARRAGIHPATATAHLRRLVDGGLVRARAEGRHRYHELAGPQVAAALEALAQIAPLTPVRSLRQHADLSALAEARTCYDHLAGRRGVELRDRLLEAGAIRLLDERDHELTPHGERLVTDLDIDLDQVRAARRVFARSCLDWTERRPHLAGALPAAITARFLGLRWLERPPAVACTSPTSTSAVSTVGCLPATTPPAEPKWGLSSRCRSFHPPGTARSGHRRSKSVNVAGNSAVGGDRIQSAANL
jgi:DNA-binding transcriptional ArsR family regulator